MKDYDVRCCSSEFWAFLTICVVPVAFAGINSGLALGLLSFGPVDLEVLLKFGQPRERKYAAKILPLVRYEDLLLCALLVGKSLAMEVLPLFLDSILPTWAAFLVSVTLVLTFTEILPQAICSRYGLSLGAKMSVLVRLLLLIFLPVAYPVSKVLDCLLGKTHSALYRRAELKTLVDLHANEAGKGGELSHHETRIISGALDLTQKTAKDAMTPISETFSLDINSKLDAQTMGLIMSKVHSRVPICTGVRRKEIEPARREEEIGCGGGGERDEIPQEVLERMLVRIAVAVLAPPAAGIGLMHVFRVVKQSGIWDVPVWVVVPTTFSCLAASALGVAYGGLSTSWDPNRTGSLLGLDEAQKNWADLWQDDPNDACSARPGPF